RLTYRELEDRANGVACRLVEAGVGHGDTVATLFERSLELVVAQLAILKVGACYMPLDVKAPLDRIAYMLSDSGCKLLVTQKSITVAEQIQLPQMDINVDTENEIISKDSTKAAVSLNSSSTDVAYLMYTSGSTGRPKGVMVSHRAIVRTVINNGFADFGPTDIIAISANPAFDINTLDVWGPLLNGGCGVVIDADTLTTPHLLADTLDKHRITIMFFTTSLFHYHAQAIGPELAKLRLIMFGGEQGNLSTFTSLRQYGGPQHLIHGYGPTEGTTIDTFYEATSDDDKLERLPIGRPISNTTIYVLDSQCRPVPIGVVGELYIG
ncbi:hypothetical protein BGW42_008251, partial [Actinomortierella wolfii]